MHDCWHVGQQGATIDAIYPIKHWNELKNTAIPRIAMFLIHFGVLGYSASIAADPVPTLHLG